MTLPSNLRSLLLTNTDKTEFESQFQNNEPHKNHILYIKMSLCLMFGQVWVKTHYGTLKNLELASIYCSFKEGGLIHSIL